jgi:hypothetical protein
MGADAAAISFSVHTGWAAAVSVAGPLRAPRILDRRSIRLTDSVDTAGADVYHRAADLSAVAAAKLVRKAQDAALRNARAGLEAVQQSHPLVAAGIVGMAKKLPSDLAAILRSHPLIHSAEGVLYREALAKAAADCGLEVVRVSRPELLERFASALRTDEATARARLDSMGREIGPPWTRDQKEAAMAAVVALVEGAKRK